MSMAPFMGNAISFSVPAIVEQEKTNDVFIYLNRL